MNSKKKNCAVGRKKFSPQRNFLCYWLFNVQIFLDTNKDVSNVLKQVMDSDSDSSDEVCGCFIC